MDERPSTLRDYQEVLRRRKGVVLAAAIVVPVAALMISLIQPSLYRASAGVLLSTQNLAATLEGLPDPAQDPERLLTTQVELARVPEVARRTLIASGVNGWDAAQLLSHSSVSAGAQSDVLTFAVTDSNRLLATRLATEYARQFIRYRFELDTQALRTARASVVKRMTALKAAGGDGSELYASLAEKKEQLDTLESLQTARAVLVRAAGEAVQVQPQPKRNALLGLALGLLLGLGLAALLEALDSRVRSSDAVAERLGLPLLARIPTPERFSGIDELVTLSDADSPEAESFRILRTNLEWVSTEGKVQTILFTSAVEKEGKSTTAANLAVALARAGRRVALVDLDLRSPTLHRLFRVAQSPGLTDIVLGGGVPEAAVTSSIDIDLTPRESKSSRSTQRGRWGDGSLVPILVDSGDRRSEGSLELLTVGTLPPHPGEFIPRHPIGPILDYLKSHNEFVLIDGPPLLPVGDAISLSALVDALVVVARINVIHDSMLDDLDRSLRGCAAPPLGLVVVGVPVETGYGYHPYPRTQPRAVA